MPIHPINVPDLLQHRASLLGDVGKSWLASVEERLSAIEQQWDVRIGKQLSGGTEALVFLATRGSNQWVVKLGLPHSLDREALTLRLADGSGYAALVDYDESNDALLLERLGNKLVDSRLPVNQQIEIICRTLKIAWRSIDSAVGLVSGADKAAAQFDYIRTQWEALGQPCPTRVIDVALEYAAERLDAHTPERCCLVHGDAHVWNTLASRESPTGYKFVDPDGLFAEPAFDLAISLREWRDELLQDGDTRSMGQRRCERLSELTGVDSNAIWQWGFIEHVSCGLLDLNLGDRDAADQHFTISERWLDA